MEKHTHEIDVLLRLLQEEKYSGLLYEALKVELEENPTEFYKTYVIPRSGRLRETAMEGLVTKLTIVQEVQQMNQATAPVKEQHADETDT